jgi:cold shock CspA family protein
MYRIRGTVKLTGVIKVFSIVTGDDGVEYFTIPSLFRHPRTYPCLKQGSVVEFEPKATEHGWRASDVTVLSLTTKDADTHGEEIRLQ